MPWQHWCYRLWRHHWIQVTRRGECSMYRLDIHLGVGIGGRDLLGMLKCYHVRCFVGPETGVPWVLWPWSSSSSSSSSSFTSISMSNHINCHLIKLHHHFHNLSFLSAACFFFAGFIRAGGWMVILYCRWWHLPKESRPRILQDWVEGNNQAFASKPGGEKCA